MSGRHLHVEAFGVQDPGGGHAGDEQLQLGGGGATQSPRVVEACGCLGAQCLFGLGQGGVHRGVVGQGGQGAGAL